MFDKPSRFTDDWFIEDVIKCYKWVLTEAAQRWSEWQIYLENDWWVAVEGLARALTPCLTLIWDTGLQFQTVRQVWCQSWPDTVWHSPRYLSECVFMWAVGQRETEYCNHHLLSYESCWSSGGETVLWLLFPSALLSGFKTRWLMLVDLWSSIIW